MGGAVCHPARPSVHSALSRKEVLVMESDAASGLDMGWLRDMSSSSPVEFDNTNEEAKKGKGRAAAGVVPTAVSQQ